MKTLLGASAALLMGVALITPAHADAPAASAQTLPSAFQCVTVGPLYVLGQPVVTDQYSVCVPSPAAP